MIRRHRKHAKRSPDRLADDGSQRIDAAMQADNRAKEDAFRVALRKRFGPHEDAE